MTSWNQTGWFNRSILSVKQSCNMLTGCYKHLLLEKLLSSEPTEPLKRQIDPSTTRRTETLCARLVFLKHLSDLYRSSWVKSSCSWQTEEQKLSNRTSTSGSNICHLLQPLNLRVRTPAGGHGMVIRGRMIDRVRKSKRIITQDCELVNITFKQLNTDSQN